MPLAEPFTTATAPLFDAVQAGHFDVIEYLLDPDSTPTLDTIGFFDQESLSNSII